MTDHQIKQGGFEGKRAPMFQVSDEGGVYRRRNGGDVNDYALHGYLAVNTAETRAEILRRVRNARPDADNHYARVKDMRAIIDAYNRELQAEA